MRLFKIGYDPEALIPGERRLAQRARRSPATMGGALMPRQPAPAGKKVGSLIVQTGIAGDEVGCGGGGFAEGIGHGVGVGLSVLGVVAAYTYVKGKKLI